MPQAKTIVKNQYGEQSTNSNIGSLQPQANAQPAKTGVQALTALAGGATLADVIVAYNALLAALKVVS